jgi:hypothetical protein
LKQAFEAKPTQKRRTTMKTMSRFTAIIFMVLGLLVILVGMYLAMNSFKTLPSESSSMPGQVVDFSGLYLLAKIFVGGAIGLNGLFLIAIGQGLWLLASISDQTERTSLYMYNLLERVGKPK